MSGVGGDDLAHDSFLAKVAKPSRGLEMMGAMNQLEKQYHPPRSLSTKIGKPGVPSTAKCPPTPLTSPETADTGHQTVASSTASSHEQMKS